MITCGNAQLAAQAAAAEENIQSGIGRRNQAQRF
jgi:hypothetical protein